MGTYLTTLLPGAGDDRRLIGINSIGQAAFVTRLLPQTDALAGELPQRLRPARRSDSPRLATLVELGTADGWVFVVEKAAPALPLERILAAARAANVPLAPEVCAWFAARVSEAAASLGECGHLRLSLQNVLVRPAGEPYLLGGAWARLLSPAPGEPVPEWFAPGRERQADAYAAAELARQLATLGAASGPADWGAMPTSLKAVFARATSGRLSSAALAGELDSTLQSWDRRPEAVAVGAWLRQLPLPAWQPPVADGPRLVLAPLAGESPEQEWSADGPALGIDGRLERPDGLQLEPLAAAASGADSPPPAATGEAPLALDERAFAHAFAPAPEAQVAPPRLARLRLRRWSSKLLLFAVVAAGAAALWSERDGIAPWLENTLPAMHRDRPRGAMGTALLRIDSSPDGAEVRLGDELLGQTPYLGDNDLPPGKYTVRLTKKGFQEATVSFEGAQDAHLEVLLRPR